VIPGIGAAVAEIARLEAALAPSPGLADRLFADSERQGLISRLLGCLAGADAAAWALGAPNCLISADEVIHRDTAVSQCWRP
jgi:hypothetical protein